MLKNVVTDGTGAAAELNDRQVAGKTGTSDQARDLWFIGYIPQLAAGVWLGNDDNSPTYGNSGSAAYTWHEFMEKAVEGMSVEKFPSLPKLENRKGSIKAEPIKPKKVIRRVINDNDQKSDRDNTENSDSSTRRRRRRRYSQEENTTENTPRRRRRYSQSEDTTENTPRRRRRYSQSEDTTENTPRRRRRYSQSEDTTDSRSRRRRRYSQEENNTSASSRRKRQYRSEESRSENLSSSTENNSGASSPPQPSWRERLKPNSSPGL
jgi:penicillin-binding protein 1A